MRLCLLALACLGITAAQNGAEDFKVYTEYPRLLLNAKRLRLLKRERERQSPRWNQFETLVRGKAAMPEPAFAKALYFQVTGEAEAASAAIQAALLPGTDIRQVAVVWDWCQANLSQDQRAQLKSRLERSLREPITSTTSARDHVFAAITLGDAEAMRQVVIEWWRKTLVPALQSGKRRLEHSDIYPLVELLHAVRDNVQIELHEDTPRIFKDLPLQRILSYYPAPFPTPANDFHIPWNDGKGEPDLRLASLTRVSELALVAYESNAQEMQFLQGWLLHDRFTLRTPFGAPYEFLWANPYHPGLPFEKLPLMLHNDQTGMLLLRSSWEEDATWIGIVPGFSQVFEDGHTRPASFQKPVTAGDYVLLGGSPDRREFRVSGEGSVGWFLVGMKPRTGFDIEVDDEEMTDGRSDPAGTLSLRFPGGNGQNVFVHEPRMPAMPEQKSLGSFGTIRKLAR